MMSRLSIPTSGGERPNRRDCASLSPCARIGSRDNGFNALGLGVLAASVADLSMFLDQQLTWLADRDFQRAHEGRPEVWG